MVAIHQPTAGHPNEYSSKVQQRYRRPPVFNELHAHSASLIDAR